MNNNKLNSTLYYTKGFTLIVNPLRSVSRCFCALHSCNFKPRLPELRPSGFTLAETLITLVIIGVVAALTVPTLMNRTNNQETISRLKKSYSVLSQATNQIIAEEGPVTSWSMTADEMFDLYKKKLLNARDCSKVEGCWDQGILNRLDGGVENWNSESFNKLVLQDGTQLLIAGFNNTCTLSNQYDNGSENYCSRLYVDVNGARKPNTIGRDIFLFVLKKNGLFAAGCDIEDMCTNEHRGDACACKVLREEAINY